MKFLPTLIFFVVVAFATANFPRFGLDSDEELNQDAYDDLTNYNNGYHSDIDIQEIGAEEELIEDWNKAYNRSYTLGYRKRGENEHKDKVKSNK